MTIEFRNVKKLAQRVSVVSDKFKSLVHRKPDAVLLGDLSV